MRTPASASSLSPDTLAALNQALPPFWSHANPIDILVEFPKGASLYSDETLKTIADVHAVVEKQAGVGNVANAVMSRLGERTEIPDFVMFTEVFQDSLVNLMEEGRLTGASSTALTLTEPQLQRVYDNMDFFAPRIVLRPLELSNNPGVIRRFGVITLNTALEVDIYGHANSTHVAGVNMMNGIGAQEICVTTAQGLCDFISAMDTNRLQEWNCWYQLMNCGYPLKASGEPIKIGVLIEVNCETDFAGKNADFRNFVETAAKLGLGYGYPGLRRFIDQIGVGVLPEGPHRAPAILAALRRRLLVGTPRCRARTSRAVTVIS